MWLLFLPSPALAHIKWFASYDVPEQPRLLSEVFSASFLEIAAGMLVILWLAAHIERTPLGDLLLRAILRAGAPMRARTEDLYRAGTGAFFIALFVAGNIILTPELKTELPYIPWLEAGLAIGMFWRATMVVSAAGIAALYTYGVFAYGIFHLLDYPIFLGLAAYLALSSARVRIGDFRPLDVARWGASITLMWASVEKWAYPQWTYPLLDSHPSLCMGFSSPLYMQMAGFVEFSLAFALLWTPLVRSIAATLLGAMFIGAVFDFGKVDAIGHLMIVVILVSIAVDDVQMVRRPILAPACYCGALAVTLSLYYGLHAVIYGTSIW